MSIPPSNSAQVQSFASKMHETNEEHQKLRNAQERQLQLEAQALREVYQCEQQAAQTAQEYQSMMQELRRQADEQPDRQKLLWKRQLSQQADYRAEVHELHTELLNTKEKSEMKSRLAANMCAESIIQCQAGPWSLSQRISSILYLQLIQQT